MPSKLFEVVEGKCGEEVFGGEFLLGDGSAENRRKRPVTACETEVGTVQEEEREGVFVPEEEGVRSWWL